MYTDQQIDELAGELHRVFGKVFTVLGRRDPKATAAGDLTLAQLSILITLLERGPMRMTDLATHEHVRTPTTTVAIRRLEKLGLVQRSRDPRDLRAVLVDITPRGRAERDESLAARYATLTSMLSKLSADEQQMLWKAVSPLDRLAHQGSGQP
jgi:DNA-binding MarR family transcriptional regulator